MLPLNNLKAGELFSFDALSPAENLMPEAASVIEGEFADLLQTSVASETTGTVQAGELLPESGNPLPPEPLAPTVRAPVLPADMQTFGDASSFSGTDAFVNIDTTLQQMLGESSRLPVGIPIPDAQSFAGAESMPAAVDIALQDTDVEVTADTAELLSVNGLLDNVEPAPIPVAGSAIAGAIDAQSTNPGPTIAGSTAAAIDGAIIHARNGQAAMRNQQRLPVADSLQPAQSARRELATSIEPAAAMPVAGRTEPRLDAVAEQLRHQRSRLPDTAQSSSSLRSSDEQPRILGEDIAALPPRPVVSAASTSTLVTTEAPIQVDTGPRFSSDLSAALGRQPQAIIPTTVSSTIELAVQQPGWDNALADRVTLMANGKLQNAEIRLTPAELGPLKIQLVIDDGTANVSFQAQNASTREAIEQALPRLREMLAESGLSLGQTSVGDDGVNQRGRDASENARPQAAGVSDASDDSEAPDERQQQRLLDGLVDTFA